MKHQWKLIIVLAIGLISALGEFVFHMPKLAYGLITVAVIVMAISMVIEMVKTIKSGQYGVDLLAIIAVISTILVQQYWASWMILVMLTGGDSLEDYAQSQAGKELKALLDQTPRTASRLQDGKLTTVKVEALKIGDHVIVKPGSQVPIDGKIIKGTSSFDQSSLTGESLPVTKTAGDDLMSGSINGDASVEVEVTKTAENSEYQSIVHLVESANARPAKFVKMADRYAVPFTIISLLIGFLAWGLSGEPLRFVQVMVVASPCPLILAAPVAMVAGMSRMSKNHIVVKSGTTLEKLARAKTFAFDKTGTLTQNELRLENIVMMPDASWSKAQLQYFAASAEQQSNHVLAVSLLKSTPKKKLLPVSHVIETTGQGLQGQVDGHEVKVGRLTFVAPEAAPISPQGTAIFVSIDQKLAGYLIFKDQIRPESQQTLQTLRLQGVQKTMMLTGDHRDVAKEIAKTVGVDDFKADCLPIEKINYLKAIPENLRPAVMVGDGVNDAPSLAAADVGIAMGAKGATAASESADAVVLINDLSRISKAVSISKRTMKVARVDILTAIAVVIVVELIAATGVIAPMAGAILQEAIDLTTILLALLAKTEPKREKWQSLQA